jgi:hypothetical protein
LCEQVVTNQSQLARVYDCDVFSLPANPPAFRAWLIDPQFLWADFSQLPGQFGEAFAQSQGQVHGVTVLKLRLTRLILSGETLVEFPSGTNSLTLAAPSGYEANQQRWVTRSCLGLWQQWIDWGELERTTTPTLRLDIALANVNDKPAFDASIAAEDAACAEASAISAASPGGMAMFDEMTEDFDILSADSTSSCGRLKFNKLQATGTNFFLEWFSETNATFEIASATDMTMPASNWTSVASLYPAVAGTNLTGFLDVGAATNTAKFYKVAKTGISITLCQSNTLSGVVDIPFELGMPPSQPCLGVQFLLDGAISKSIVAPDNPISTAHATWDTETTSNGWHTLQAVASYSALAVGNVALPTYVSQIVTVKTANSIVMPDFPMRFGSRLPVNATLSSSNANWTVIIRDPVGSVLQTFTGSTTVGRLSVVWTNSLPETTPVQVEVSYTTTGLDPIQLGGFAGFGPTKKNAYKLIGGFPNDYLVTYEVVCNEETSDGGVASLCYDVAVFVSDNGYNAIQSAIDDNPSSWAQWKQSLKAVNTANLYLYSHGGPSVLGYDPYSQRGLGKCGVFDSEIAAFLLNGPVGTNYFAGKLYRFVFLDGCNSAGGTWYNSFAIDDGDAASYTLRDIGPQAFMGWTDPKQHMENGNMFDRHHKDFVETFYAGWTSNKTLKQAADDAWTKVHAYDQIFTKPKIVGAETLPFQ